MSDLDRAAAAHVYAEELGVPVFPADGKIPLTAQGFKDASTDPGQINAWFERWPEANVATPTGQRTGTVVLDGDGTVGIAGVRELLGDAALSVLQSVTGGGGRHLFFAHPGEGRSIPNSAGRLAPSVDVRGDGGYVLLPPSTTSGTYRWMNPEGNLPPWPFETRRPTARAEAVALEKLAGLPKVALETPDAQAHREEACGRIRRARVGVVSDTLNAESYPLGHLVATGALDFEGTVRQLFAAARAAGHPDDRITSTLRSALGAGAGGKVLPTASTLDDTISTFRRHLYLPDTTSLLAVTGSVAANLLDGDAVWMLLVGGPSSGKTGILVPVLGLPYARLAGELTKASLLSGTSRKERAANSKGGLLREIGDFGIIVAKDFGSVLSMSGEARTEALAALREVYDGRWARHVGSDGGQELSWAGKVGFIGGCTQTIDRLHAVMGAMGERFLLHRLPGATRRNSPQTLSALKRGATPSEVQKELSAAVRRLFAGADPQSPRALSDSELERLRDLADFVAWCRSPVERGGRDHDIEVVGEESAPRLALQLKNLLLGLDLIGCDQGRAWEVVNRVALDSMPVLRLRTVVELAGAGEVETPRLADMLGYPTSSTRRTLEDLAAQGVVTRAARGTGTRADRWLLDDWAEQFLCKQETADPVVVST